MNDFVYIKDSEIKHKLPNKSNIPYNQKIK